MIDLIKKRGESMKHTIDWKVFGIGGGICLLFILFTLFWPKEAEGIFNTLLNFFCSNFGWLYLLVVTIFVFFLLWVCISKYGKIRLGGDNDKPEYSTLSWIFMLFAAGMGIGLVFWSVAEPICHYLNPPYGTGETVDAAQTAMYYSFLHWGFHPWACFGIVGLPLAYFQFRKNKPALLSSCFIPLIGEKRAEGAIGNTVNILAVFATVFGLATSLGLGVMQINSGLNYIFGIPYSTKIMVLIILITTILFIVSSVSGIRKGIRMLSNTNMILALILLLSVVCCGPTVFLLNYFVQTIGTYLSGILSTSLWTDAFQTNEGWLNSWTIFYWAWWISWGPFVGGFIARISKGRTIREFVIATMLVPVFLSFIFITIMGGTAIHLEIGGNHAVSTAVNENMAYALFALFQQIPWTHLLSIITIVLIMIFFITSADSSVYVCSMMTSHGMQEPPKTLRVFWGIAESSVAIVLLIAGGLSSLQTASIVAAFPFMIVCVLMIISFTKELKKESIPVKQ
jgi:glycine betaine transporter